MPFSNKSIFFFFFIIPTIFYAGLITHFSFNFFTYDYLWRAYNSLALSILDGRLDIPYEAIGKESLYYKEKVYMYYGALPVSFRLLLSPFIDLNSVPLAKVFVWITTTTGAAYLQYAVLNFSRPKNNTATWDLTSKAKIIFLSIIVWLGGAHFIIVQKGMLYHEVYAVMLMLSSIFIVFIWRDIFWDYSSRKYHLMTYACIAALSLHTRQTVAIALYAAVLVLICFSIFDYISRHTQGEINRKQIFNIIIKQSFFPILILLIGGATLLLLNYIRFDDLFSMTKGEYGFVRAGEIASERVCGHKVTGAGRFEFARVIPNLIYYLIGGAYTHSQIINWLGIGYVRKEFTDNVLLILLWPGLISAFILATIFTLKKLINFGESKEMSILLLLIAFSISTFLILAYATITIRYMADLWLPLGFMLMVFSNLWLTEEIDKTILIRRSLLLLFVFATIINIFYSSHLYTEYKKWTLLENTVNGSPNAAVIERLYNPKRPEEFNLEEECAHYNFNTKSWHERIFD